ncbi:MAG: SDR family NAD(P)-dependent oxidoreductase [Hyphomonadaceae bacterium]|nr:SDR family NAD(P)-dependent oxidoreductase [Hyphomonadaceae bacterium]
MGKTVFVTGAASGIGRAIAQMHAAKGDRVIAADLSADALDMLVDDGIEPWVLDVSDSRAVELAAGQIWTACSGVDWVYANAGIGAPGSLLEATPDQLRACLNVNLIGAWQTLKAFAARMVKADRPGRLCVTASEHSLGFQHVGAGMYTASKHAILGLADVMRHELPASVSISVLCPGITKTAFGDAPDASKRARAFTQAIMAEGLDPDVVARAALDGMTRGDFIIATHAASRAGWELRVKDVEMAFAHVPQEGADAERYAVPEVIRRVRAQFSEDE